MNNILNTVRNNTHTDGSLYLLIFFVCLLIPCNYCYLCYKVSNAYYLKFTLELAVLIMSELLSLMYKNYIICKTINHGVSYKSNGLLIVDF